MIMYLPFDHVYCLHLAEDQNRLKHIEEKLNIFTPDIWWTCKRAISNPIGNAINTLKTPYYESIKKPDTYGNCFNCAFEHYTIIKTAYLRRFEHILILEDDVEITESEENLQYMFDNLPKDYDLIKLYSTFGPKKKFNKEVKDLFQKDVYSWSTACYALSRKGMEEYLRIMDQIFVVADMPFQYFNRSKLNCYSLNYKFFQINDSLESTIV